MPDSPAPPDLHARNVARLADARRAAKLRQIDLAALLGWQQVYVSRLETGERQLGVDEYVAIALAIGIEPVALLAEVIAADSASESVTPV